MGLENSRNDMPIAVSFLTYDKATPPPDTQIIFTNMKIQQAPFPIPLIYPGFGWSYEVFYSIGSCSFTRNKNSHTLQLEKLFKILKKELHFFISIQRNKGKNISDSLIHEQIYVNNFDFDIISLLEVDERSSELVVEAKILSNQRIVLVTGANFSIGALVRSFLPSDKFYTWFDKNNFKVFESIGIDNVKVLCFALALAYLETIMFKNLRNKVNCAIVKNNKILKKEVGGDKQKVNEIWKTTKE
ncbi:43506_t:CDS:2 [Gigaspora margarita]|uniref:43506_t:CDS:1 n=1 Tax=Gigaspora margarita TaxID=4874 RepID=A0ABN7W8M9_GIGMA|nr:43506_t:CDS:2 [Gigaspora margarita]